MPKIVIPILQFQNLNQFDTIAYALGISEAAIALFFQVIVNSLLSDANLRLNTLGINKGWISPSNLKYLVVSAWPHVGRQIL